MPVLAASPSVESKYEDNFIQEAPYAFKIAPGEDFDPCSCVSYYKWKAGISQSISLGNAWDIFPWYLEPRDSGMVITYDGKGHIAYYEKDGEYIDIYESNYIPCKPSTRRLTIGDPIIRGYR